ncbi:M15 family metallopeptidase [soil metagenome]
MHRRLCILFIFGVIVSASCRTAPKKTNANSEIEKRSDTPAQKSSDITNADCLLHAYPEFLKSAENNLIIWKDSTVMPFDDGAEYADFETTLDRADFKDQMAQCYPLTDNYRQKLTVNYDPGRARFASFFTKMYGNSADEVEKQLVSIQWMPKNINKTIRVTSINGIDKKFQAISDELDNLPPEFMKYLQNPAGTFNWRLIAGTTRQSTHSFGTTIDINVQLSNYWRDNAPDETGIYQYKNQIPLEIVRIFEKHGFIWGGKWYHYDTMHFEYRPELLDSECVCKN